MPLLYRWTIPSIDRRWLFFWLLALPCVYYCGMNYSVELDDAFIYFRVVHTFLDTGRPEFNAGDNSFMVTSPFWTFLLAGTKRFLPFWQLPEIAKVLWILLQLLAACFAFLALRSRLGNWAPFVCLPLLLPKTNAMMGNEIALLYFAFFGTLWAVLARRPAVAGIFLGIGYLARGEFVFMSFVIVVSYMTFVRRGDLNDGRRRILSEFILIAGAAVLVASLWHIYSLAVFGSFFPATLKAKMVQGAVGRFGSYLNDVWKYVRLIGLDRHVFLLGLVAMGISRRPTWALIAGIYLFCHSLMYAFLGLPAYHWYYYDYFLFVLLFLYFGVFGFLDVLRAGGNRLTQRIGAVPLWRISAPFCASILVVGFTAWFIPIRLHKLPTGPFLQFLENRPRSERYLTYVAVSRFLDDRLREGDTVLGPEVGIVSHCLRGREIRDSNGLATPGLKPEQISNYDYLVHRFEPRFVLLPVNRTDASMVYQWRGRVFYYERTFMARPHAQRYVGTLYERRAVHPFLQALSTHGRRSPEIRAVLIDGMPALFCRTPFQADIPVSERISWLDLDVGFSPKVHRYFEKASRASNGVDLIIWGLGAGGEPEELVRCHLMPFEGRELAPSRRIDLAVPSRFSSLRLCLDPIDGNSAFDWIHMKVK